MIDLVVFPSSYFNKNKVDESLITEYNSAISTGLFDTVIFCYDKLIDENRLILSRNFDKKRKAIYRGWMMHPTKYKFFYDSLLIKNIELVTTPEEYELMHIFPNIYSHFGNDTARMKLFPLHKQIKVDDLNKDFDKYMIKDYVKSVKGTDFPKFFDRNTTQDELDNWMNVFYKYRGNLLTGGICVKEFLPLKFYGERTNEYRVFYINHKIATISKNSAQPNYVPEVPKKLVEKYNNIDSIYYTVDFAELENGTWKVIEAGDGSVSGLSEFQDVEQYYRALYHCFNL